MGGPTIGYCEGERAMILLIIEGGVLQDVLTDAAEGVVPTADRVVKLEYDKGGSPDEMTPDANGDLCVASEWAPISAPKICADALETVRAQEARDG